MYQQRRPNLSGPQAHTAWRHSSPYYSRSPTAVQPSTPPNYIGWTLDTGTSHHMTSNPHALYDATPY